MTKILRGALDTMISKIVSRKLLVFGIATAMLVFDKLTGADWVTIAGIYIGTQGVIDGITKMRGQ